MRRESYKKNKGECDLKTLVQNILKNNCWTIVICKSINFSKGKSQVIKISLQWKISLNLVIIKILVKSFRLTKFRVWAKQIKNSIQVSVVKILVSQIYITRIVNNSSFSNLISLLILKSEQIIIVVMSTKLRVVISNYPRLVVVWIS